MDRVKSLRYHLGDDDYIGEVQYNRDFAYLLGCALHSRTTELKKIKNPLNWPAMFLVFFLAPFISTVSVQKSNAFRQVMDGIYKQVGTLFFFLAFIWLLSFVYHQSAWSMIAKYVDKVTGQK